MLTGYSNVVSLKTGVRGWNDFEAPLVDEAGKAVDGDSAEEQLAADVRPGAARAGNWNVARGHRYSGPLRSRQ